MIEQIMHERKTDVDQNQDRNVKPKSLVLKLDDPSVVRRSHPIPITSKVISHPTDSTGTRVPCDTILPPSLAAESADQQLAFLENVKAVLDSQEGASHQKIKTSPLVIPRKPFSYSSSTPDRFTPKSVDSLTAEYDSRFDFNQSGYSTVESSYRASPTSEITPAAWAAMSSFEAPILEAEDTEEKIAYLLQKAPDDVLSFHESSSVYLDDESHLVFVRDIVSMWNMPFRGNAHIVLGVSPPRTGPPSQADLKGIPPNHKREDDFYQSLFSKIPTNNMPDFKYSESECGGKIYGVFTISSSRGRGEPCILIQTAGSKLSNTTGDIWCRKLSKNTPATTEQLRSIVFRWFEGTPCGPPEEVFSSFSTTDKFDDLTYSESQSQETSMETVFPVDKFLQAADNFDKKRSYCLVTNCNTKAVSGRLLHSIGYLPWLKVFDFDVASSKTGVLAAAHDGLKRRRNVCITTWMEEVRPLNHFSTEWFFPRGYQNKRESVCDEDDRQWNRKAGKKVDSHCQVLVEYCMARTPLTVVVLWYAQKGDIAFLDRFMRRLEDSLGSEMHAVLCYDKIVPDEKGVVESLQKILRMGMIDGLPLGVVCGTFERLFSEEPLQALICRQRSEYCLPTYDKSNNPQISVVDAAWLSSGLDVLYLNDPHTSGNINDSSLGQEFYRGGVLSWYEIRVHRFDVERDSEQTFISCIDSHINKAKSALLVLNHAPGSGGSTLAKRVLWEVHRKGKSPCASVISLENIKETVKQVDFLAENTSSSGTLN
ncbi:uncharacterized protein [Amphiura filiformis]|uniref:uncharacterized protein n=1 Tax=Amphiura filiformis TaxID=82378 RepID=UPI003B2283ED